MAWAEFTIRRISGAVHDADSLLTPVSDGSLGGSEEVSLDRQDETTIEARSTTTPQIIRMKEAYDGSVSENKITKVSRNLTHNPLPLSIAMVANSKFCTELFCAAAEVRRVT